MVCDLKYWCIEMFIRCRLSFCILLLQPLQDQATSETEEEGNNKQSMKDNNNTMLTYTYCDFVFQAERKVKPKKKHQENVASCEKCNVSFAKLLKRKVSACQHVCHFFG